MTTVAGDLDKTPDALALATACRELRAARRQLARANGRSVELEQELRRLTAAVHEYAADARFGWEDGDRSQLIAANWDLRESTRSLLEDLPPAKRAA